MVGLRKKYRLRKPRPTADFYEFLDLESGALIGVAVPAAVKSAARGPSGPTLGFLFSFRLTRYCIAAIGVVLSAFWFAGAILGIWPFQSRASSPRLVVRRPDDRRVVFTLRVSSGLLYDSRRVYDGQGGLIAHFRSWSKSTVRGGFEIIELTGCEDDDADVRWGASFGRVEPSGGGRTVYRLCLADNPDAVRIIHHTDHYDIEVSATLRHDATSELLLLAAALTLAWSPGERDCSA
jgi:hypothetical protein